MCVCEREREGGLHCVCVCARARASTRVWVCGCVGVWVCGLCVCTVIIMRMGAADVNQNDGVHTTYISILILYSCIYTYMYT